MEIVAITDIGKVREVNQDCALYYQKNDHEGLAVLCDGMGGHKAGEIASSLACHDIIKNYRIHGEFLNEDEMKSWLSEAIYHANQLIQQESYLDEKLEGMGTTVVVALLKDQTIYISHVGDSRAYYFNGENIQQLTRDDTLVNALVESGTITKDEAENHPQKNILLQAVGVNDALKVSYYSQKMESGMILLCSDGLYNSLFDHQIIDILKAESSLEDLSQQLIDQANEFGGRDNIGVILMRDKGVIEDE